MSVPGKCVRAVVVAALLVVASSLHVDLVAQRSRSPLSNRSVDTIPFDYDAHLNLPYVSRAGWQGTLDLWLPANVSESTRILVWFHGGGWTRSSKEQELLYVLPYMARQWAIVNVEYRLADVAKAPAAASDAVCAMRWVGLHAADFRLALNRIVVSGISAGGTMALIAGALPRHSTLAQDCGQELAKSVIPDPRVIINWFGPSDLVDLIDGPHRQKQVASWFDRVSDRIPVARAISPASFINSRGPAVMTIHGRPDADVPYERSVRLHRLLESFGTQNRLITVDAGHGDFTAAQAADAYAHVFRFIDSILGE